MHRRGAGVGAIKNRSAVQAKFKDKGSEIATEQLAEMSSQMEVFRKNLEEFASKHKEEIRKNPQFRKQFQEMCSSIGVDPLASSKGFWCKMLGVGDFYYELGVMVIEICMANSHKNGGLMELEELRQRVNSLQVKNKEDVSCDDILTSIKTLKILGSGFKALPLTGGKYLVQSIPGELSMDHTSLLSLAEGKGFVTCCELKEKLRWEDERVNRALEFMLLEGLAWVDEQPEEKQFWFPALFHEIKTAC